MTQPVWERPTNERRTVLAVIKFLGVFAILGLVSTTVLIVLDKSGEQVALVVGMTSAALGAIGGLLSSTNTSAPSKQALKPPPIPAAQPEQSLEDDDFRESH